MDLGDPVRGRGGFSQILLDVAEVEARDDECRRFRASAGVEGTCLEWVIAHEAAHQWFLPDPAGVSDSDVVVWESLADYLALEWWRSRYADQAADRLISDLLVGRLQLRPEFATTRAPALAPDILSDLEERALIRGRGSLAWVAMRGSVGAVRTAHVVRAVLADEAPLTVANVLATATHVDRAASDVLHRWWRVPRLGRDDLAVVVD